jgi:TolA-binding protein/predicted negative regulator of RcsB-dependent stress response
MRTRLVILFVFWIHCTSARADFLDDAIQAYRTGIPEVSITKLRQFLASQPVPDRAEAARTLLAQCLIETGKADEAAKLLEKSTGPEATFLKAQEAFRSRRWQEAADWFARLIATSTWYSVEARLGLADSQKALGESAAALETLQPLIADDQTADPRGEILAAEIYLGESNDSKAEALLSRVKTNSRKTALEKLCLEGEVALKEGKMTEAAEAFNKVLAEPDDRTLRMITIARLGLAKVLVESQEFEEAETELEKLISDDPRSPILGDLFANLFEIYSKEDNPETSELARWGAENPETSGPDRPAYALYYLARLQLQQGLITQATENCSALVERFPGHPISVEACLILGRQQLEAGNPDNAVKQLESLLQRSPNLAPADRFRVKYLLGELYYRRGNTAAARDIFLSLSKTFDYDWQKTLFNLAICSLRLGDAADFEQAFHKLKEREPHDDLMGDLLFAKALFQAKSGNGSADKTLETLLDEFPSHPQAAQARLMQAEIRMTEQPHNLNGARQALSEISSSSDQVLEERADRLKFFAAADDPSQNVRAVQTLAQEYLQKYPDSPSKAEVRLKLGELYFRDNDFPNAQTQFEFVGEESPDSPLVESALFLAAEAARKSLNSASVDRAISLFEEVYKLGGPLRFQARLEQATTMRQTKQEKEAVVLLDDLLTQTPPADIRYQALDEKGKALFTLAANEPKLYEQAVKTFDTLISSDGLPIEWKQQAIYQKGKCFEKLGKMDEALSNYYDVLAVEGGGGDQLWFFRAGFDSAQILEDRRSWSSAAAVYEKLANTRGARSEEAKERLTRIRLEHFLWPE